MGAGETAGRTRQGSRLEQLQYVHGVEFQVPERRGIRVTFAVHRVWASRMSP
jgi:ribosome biogenesis SPOUT family RNA methylase Rps3